MLKHALITSQRSKLELGLDSMLFESNLTISVTNAALSLITGLMLQTTRLTSFQTFRYTEYVSCMYISILAQTTKVVLKRISPLLHFSVHRSSFQSSFGAR